MLSVQDLEKRMGGRALLEGASFRLGSGEKVALVGVNGSGKSTLLRICAGLIEHDGGEISLPKETTIGYLPQHADLISEKTLFEELRMVFEHVDSHMAEMETIAHRMGEIPHESDEYNTIADRYGHLQHEIDRLGAYEIDARIDKMIAGLGFRPGDRDRKCAEFSGGWQMRILLASLLLRNPDLLLLDEPTNHLDLETMIWLENWIRVGDATVLFVSHERKFMDALAERVFEVHEGKLAIYKGNYTEYLRQREDRWAQWQREYDNQQDEMRHLQKFIDRFRYNASKASLVQSRVKALEKIVPIPPPPKAAASIKFRFPPPDRGSKEVFHGEGIVKKYGDLTVLNKIDFALWRGEKVALVGVNGAGKSTLLKILRGIEEPTAGKIESGSKSKMEYFAQYDSDGISPENTVWNEISTVAPVGLQEQARALLGGFFFKGDDVEKQVKVLSGGERTRLRLAKMLFTGANVLLLDEPTNHLDIASRATLERALKDFEGSVVIVSHDRTFIDSVTTRIVEVKDGGVRSFPGNYSEYCHALKVLGESSPLVDSISDSSRKGSGPPGADRNGSDKKKKKEEKRAIAPAAAPEAAAAPSAQNSRGMDHREASREKSRLKKLVDQLEREILKLEARQTEIEKELARPEIYRDHTRCAPLTQEQTKLKEHHAAYLAQWTAQAAALEQA